MSAQSYNYRSSTHNDSWAHNASRVIPWSKDEADSGDVDTANAQLVIDNKVLPAAEFTLTWAGSPTYTITVQQKTNTTVMPQTSFVVVAGSKVAVSEPAKDEAARFFGGAVPPKGGFWVDIDAALPPNIFRMRDRVFIGNAAMHHGKRSGVNDTWLPTDTVGAAWGTRDSQLAVMQERGVIAITGISRSSDGEGIPYASPIGIAGFVINDTSEANKAAWAGYFDVQHEPNGVATTSYGIEIALKNKAADFAGTPYGVGSGVHGIWFQTGGHEAYGGLSANPINSCITFRKGSSTANVGILMEKGSITGTDGVTGTGVAMALARGHRINWYFDNAGVGTVGAYIYSAVDAPGSMVFQVFDDNTIQWFGNNSNRMFSAAWVANGVNGLQVRAAPTGSPAILLPTSPDNDCSMRLEAKGTGVITVAAKLSPLASTAARAQINLPTGPAPTSPVDGDIWREDNTNTGLKIRVNGVTKTVTLA